MYIEFVNYCPTSSTRTDTFGSAAHNDVSKGKFPSNAAAQTVSVAFMEEKRIATVTVHAVHAL